MKLDVRIGETTRKVELEREAGGHLRVLLDDREIEVDAVEVSPGVYSILLSGVAFEAHVRPDGAGLWVICNGSGFPASVRDPRAWRGARGGLLEAEGRQQVGAPMPGKVVRVLVKAGESVEARQGLMVVEAMKMQNEIRAPKSGTVERIFVQEGQNVASGDPLIVIV